MRSGLARVEPRRLLRLREDPLRIPLLHRATTSGHEYVVAWIGERAAELPCDQQLPQFGEQGGDPHVSAFERTADEDMPRCLERDTAVTPEPHSKTSLLQACFTLGAWIRG